MNNRRRLLMTIGGVVLLGAIASIGGWVRARHQPAPAVDSGVEIRVAAGTDSGPGSLREALFAADAADRAATIVVAATHLELESPLPPLVNAHGIRIVGPVQGVEIDAHAIGAGPVLDVSAAHSAISHVRLRNCAGTGVLVRASAVHIASIEIDSCDIGVDVAENAGEVSIEQSRFAKNRIGVRFTASSRDSVVAGNRFADHTGAGIWATRGALDVAHGVAVSVHDNAFDGDRLGVLVGNVALDIERNAISGAHDAGIYVIGAGVTARGNRVTGGASMGIMADGARGAIIEANEIANLPAYGLLVRHSAGTLIQRNRIHHCGYGMGFVLGDPHAPSTVVDNAIVAPQYDGIDVVGDSPSLRLNRVTEARAQALKVENFRADDGTVVASHPFLADNTFGATAAGAPPPESLPPGAPLASTK